MTVALLGVTTAVSSPEDFYRAYIPAPVVLGMTPDQVQKARPRAVVGQSTQPSAAKPDSTFFEMVEVASQGTTRVAYWYRFKENTLGAVTRSLLTAPLPVEHAQAGAKAVAAELTANFALVRSDQVVRSTGAKNSVLTAQLWEDKSRGLNLYFVATDREITLIMFDPKTFEKADFFLGPERLEALDRHAESVRQQTENTAPTDKPIVDLLSSDAISSTTSTPPSPDTKASGAVPSDRASASASPGSRALTVQSQRPLWPWLVGLLLAIVAAGFIVKKKSGTPRR